VSTSREYPEFAKRDRIITARKLSLVEDKNGIPISSCPILQRWVIP